MQLDRTNALVAGTAGAATLLADIVANAIHFAPIAASRLFTLARGATLGGVAGLGAVVLTPMLGLPKRHRGTDAHGQLMTIGLM